MLEDVYFKVKEYDSTRGFKQQTRLAQPEPFGSAEPRFQYEPPLKEDTVKCRQ